MQKQQINNQQQAFAQNKSTGGIYYQQNPTQFYQYVQQNQQSQPQFALQSVQHYPQQQQVLLQSQQQQQQVPITQIKQLPPQFVQQSKTPTASKQQQIVFGAQVQQVQQQQTSLQQQPKQISVLGGQVYQQQIVLPRFVQSVIPVETCAVLADIGGTNSRFCLKQFNKETVDVSFEEKEIFTYNTQSQDYDSFYAIVDKFFKEVVMKSGLQPTLAVLSFAGPIKENTVIISNQPAHWPSEPIKQTQILKQFPQLAKCIFMNDFEAIGYAFSRKDKLDLFTVHKGALKSDNKKYPMAVLGPGTGLGEAIINPIPAKNNTQEYHVFPTEGGHATFAPITAEEFEFTEFVKKERSLSYVCNEVAFAGQAIPYIYGFFRNKSHEHNKISHQQNELKTKLENNEITQPEYDAQYNRLIVQNGINDQDPICHQTMKFLVKILATEIGNFGIRAIARDGVFVVGSLINSLANFIEKHYDEIFRPVYFNKDKMIHLLEEIPVYIVKTKELGLIGCFNQAQKFAFEN